MISADLTLRETYFHFVSQGKELDWKMGYWIEEWALGNEQWAMWYYIIYIELAFSMYTADFSWACFVSCMKPGYEKISCISFHLQNLRDYTQDHIHHLKFVLPTFEDIFTLVSDNLAGVHLLSCQQFLKPRLNSKPSNISISSY